MKHINEFNTFTGQEVANHIEYITPDSSDIPDHFIDKYILPNNGWKNKSIKLKDLLKDRDFKEYYKSGEERYDEYEVSGDDLYQELVVYKGQLLDGYSRASRMLRQGEKTAAAFVLEKQTLIKDMKYIKSINEARQAPAKRLFKDVVKGNTTSIEGQKISKEMAQAALDWFDRSVYARKYANQVQRAGMGTVAPLIFGDYWGIKKTISRKLKDEFKQLQDVYKGAPIGEKVEYSSTHINGEKVTSSWAGTSDNLREFIKMIEDAPETLDYIDVTSSTGHFSPAREKFKAPITNSKKKQIIKIVKAVEKEFKKKGDPITTFRFQSYYGASNSDRHLSDPAYISYRTKGIDKFSDDMSSGKYGSLD